MNLYTHHFSLLSFLKTFQFSFLSEVLIFLLCLSLFFNEQRNTESASFADLLKCSFQILLTRGLARPRPCLSKSTLTAAFSLALR